MFGLERQAFAKKSLFVSSGTYQNPVLRTYNTNFNADVVNEYLRATDNATNINPVSMASVAGHMIAPSAMPTGSIGISNGWQTERLMFVIELEYVHVAGNQTVVVTGYTDHAGVGFSNSFDPNMRLYINTTSMLNTHEVRTPYGMTQQRSLVDTSHLLSPALVQNVHGLKPPENPYQMNSLFNMDPQNVIRQIQSNNIDRAHSIGGINDMRSVLNPGDVVKSRRENALPGSYSSKILSSVTAKYTEIDLGTVSDEHDALNQAASMVRPSDILHDPFIIDLERKTGFRTQGFVTWAELTSIIGNLDSITVFSPRKPVNTSVMGGIDAVAGNFQNWNSVTKETILAQLLAQAIPGLMASSLVGNISFIFTNDGNGLLLPKIEVVGGYSLIEGLEFYGRAETFKSRFLSEIVPQLTDYGNTLVNLAVSASLGTETFITISRDNGPHVPFCAPTFADHLFSPVIATERSTIETVAGDFQNFVQSVHTSSYLLR